MKNRRIVKILDCWIRTLIVPSLLWTRSPDFCRQNAAPRRSITLVCHKRMRTVSRTIGDIARCRSLREGGWGGLGKMSSDDIYLTTGGLKGRGWSEKTFSMKIQDLGTIGEYWKDAHYILPLTQRIVIPSSKNKDASKNKNEQRQIRRSREVDRFTCNCATSFSWVSLALTAFLSSVALCFSKLS